MTPPTRVLLAEDHQVLREGLRSLLEGEPHLQVVGETADGFEAVVLATDLRPDVVILDVGLPSLSGIDAARRITRELEGIQVIILSMHDDAATVDKALQAGAAAYVVKGEGIGAVREALRKVAAGERYLSPQVAQLASPEGAPGGCPLTAREQEIVKLVAEGHTGRQIAKMLCISPKTVENHRARVMEKLELSSTAALVRYAIKAGLTP